MTVNHPGFLTASGFSLDVLQIPSFSKLRDILFILYHSSKAEFSTPIGQKAHIVFVLPRE